MAGRPLQKRAIEKVRRHDVLKCRQEMGGHFRVSFRQPTQELANGISLGLSAQSARLDRELFQRRKLRNFLFSRINERSDDRESAIVRLESGWHGRDPTAEEGIEQERLQGIVTMMAESHLVTTQLFRLVIKNATAVAATERAGGVAVSDSFDNEGVRILPNDTVWKSFPLEVGANPPCVKTGMGLIEVDGDEVERDRRSSLKTPQKVEKRVRVLAPGNADKDAVTGFDQAPLGNRLPHRPRQFALESLDLPFAIDGC